jgi:hypothetical protein
MPCDLMVYLIVDLGLWIWHKRLAAHLLQGA